MFKYRERMLDVIPRWSVTPRIKEQSVASHSFYVALYTDQLCILSGWSIADRYAAVVHALKHDMPEIVTGDILGPTKYAVDHKRLEAIEDRTLAELGDYYATPPNLKGRYIPGKNPLRDIVKAANIIDEYFQMSLEMCLGNRAVARLHKDVEERMERALILVGLSNVASKIVKEADQMLQGIDYIHNTRNYDG